MVWEVGTVISWLRRSADIWPRPSPLWPGWEDEVAAVPPHQGLSVYPPPFSREGKDIAAASRRVVPVQELFSFYDGAARQIGTGRPD